DGRRFRHQVRGHDREQRGETVFVVGQGVSERRLGGASARSHDEIDVSNFVALANERFPNAQSIDFRHRHLLPRKTTTSWYPNTEDFDAGQIGYPCCQRPAPTARPVSQIAADSSPAPASPSLFDDGGKMFRTRRANSVATVRSALVPGFIPSHLSWASQSSSSGSKSSNGSCNCTRW